MEIASNSFFTYLNNESDIRDIILRDGGRFKSLASFSEIVLRGKSELSFAERETIATFVSALNSCTFCYNSHLEVSKQFGVDENLIEQLLKDIDTSPISDKMKPVYHYVKKLTLSPSKMINSDADKVFEAGWSEQALTDAICVCSLFNLYNRLLDGHGIKGTQKSYDFGGKHLSKRGYKISWIPRLLYRFGWLN